MDIRINGAQPETERRRWTRLPLAIRRVLSAVAQIRLEIPSSPVAELAPLPRASRSLRARTLRITPAQGYYLVGIKFSRPLLLTREGTRRKKALSVV